MYPKTPDPELKKSRTKNPESFSSTTPTDPEPFEKLEMFIREIKRENNGVSMTLLTRGASKIGYNISV
uniref:Uncharacterized protein n=1 Tax=Malus domestica TaxID=3750 RepID=E4Z8L2_MALDO|nr:hypothetical protein [Malus domestica]